MTDQHDRARSTFAGGQAMNKANVIRDAHEARAVVGWSREVREFELGRSDSKQGTVQKWQLALEAAAVKFIGPDDQDGPGVRLRGTKPRR